jgi:hypothetical protein
MVVHGRVATRTGPCRVGQRRLPPLRFAWRAAVRRASARIAAPSSIVRTASAKRPWSPELAREGSARADRGDGRPCTSGGAAGRAAT